jgi:hypothetical protein
MRVDSSIFLELTSKQFLMSNENTSLFGLFVNDVQAFHILV